jgi:hypothetical protein
MYRAYYGTSASERIPALQKDRWPFREFPDLDQALQWAASVAKKGTSVLEIDGDDGTQLSRDEIAAALAGRAGL